MVNNKLTAIMVQLSIKMQLLIIFSIVVALTIPCFNIFYREDDNACDTQKEKVSLCNASAQVVHISTWSCQEQ